jgi:hypothetical protein
MRPPAGTRFPVRPSLNGFDQMVTSPDSDKNRTPPPIPSRSHERIKSIQQQTLSRKGSLLSPPDTGVMDGQNSGDMNFRSKRHGMVTPRGLEGSALSPTALQEAFGGFSQPHSRTTSNVSTSSITTNSILETSKLIFSTAGDLSRRLNSMRPMLEWQNQTTLKNQVELDLRIASSRIDILGRTLRRAQKEMGVSNSQRPSYLLRPVIECLRSISQFAKCLGQCSIAFTRSSNYDNYKVTFWEIQKDTWDLYIANTKLADSIRSANHSRHTSTSSHYKQISYERPNIAAAFGHNRNAPSRNGFSSSPNGSSYTSHRSQSSTTSNPFSPPVIASQYPPPVPILAAEGMYLEDSRQDAQIDGLWYGFYQSLKTLCDRATEGLPKIQTHYYEQRQRAVRVYDQDHEAVRQLGSLVARSNHLVEVANRLSAKLDSVNPSDKAIRHSMEFWQLCRTIILVCTCLFLFEQTLTSIGMAWIRGQDSLAISPSINNSL